MKHTLGAATGLLEHLTGLTCTAKEVGFGVGIGWAPEEFEWCGVPFAPDLRGSSRVHSGYAAIE